MNDEFAFFIAAMPNSRPADFYLGCLEGSVFMDFDNYPNKRICLKRISFDGYGCCSLGEEATPMSQFDSHAFKEIIDAGLSEQSRLTSIVKRTISSNRKLIWEDALNEYGLS